MAKEALDAVKEGRPFAGVHILAMAMMCSRASADELELARRILERDPKEPAPREAETLADCFNRQMDAAIDACDRSRGEPTRAGRRARLAADLDREGLLIVDRDYLAGLIAARLDETEPFGEDLGAELLDDEPRFPESVPAWDGEIRPGNLCVGRAGTVGPIGGSMADAGGYWIDAGGDWIGDVGRDPIGDYSNPNVND